MPERLITLLTLLLLVALHVVMFGRGGALDGVLAGPDEYLRLARTREWIAGFDWYDTRLDRANAPYGLELHWSRPLDILLAAGGIVLMPMLGLDRAILVWGLAIAPIAQMLFLLALIWAARPMLTPVASALCGLVALAQPVVLLPFQPGRIDNQSLLLVLFVVSLGAMLRIVRGRPDRTPIVLGGVALGLSVWIEIDALVPLLVLQGALVLVWIGRGGSLPHGGKTMATGLALALVAALAVERSPSAWLTPQYDRLSIVHLMIGLLSLMFWSFADWMFAKGNGRVLGRAAFAIGGGVAAMGVLVLAYPESLSGPLAATGPRAYGLWLGFMTDDSRLLGGSSAAAVMRDLMLYFGPVLVALLGLALYLRRAGNEDRAALFTLVALLLIGFGGLVLFADGGRRWAAYATVAALPPLTYLIVAAIDALQSLKPMAVRLLGGGAAALGIAIAPTMAAAPIVGSAVGLGLDRGPPGRCDVRAAAGPLNPGGIHGRSLTVLALPRHGAEILYRTPYRVVAIGYRGDADGISAAHDFFTSADPGRAEEVARTRWVSRVLFCPGDTGRFYARFTDDRRALVHRLLANDPPTWLVPRAGRAGGFQIYDVDRDAIPARGS
jgi:hypothetical protein